jgi:hypothetical protein
VVDRGVSAHRDDDHDPGSGTDISRALTLRVAGGTFHLAPAMNSNRLKIGWNEVLINV